MMVAALGGSARTDLPDPRGIPLLGYRSFPIGDIFAQGTTQNVNRFINGVTAQYPTRRGSTFARTSAMAGRAHETIPRAQRGRSTNPHAP